jgi:hypothetical protein
MIIIADRGKKTRETVKGILIHTTGSGLVQKAKKLKKDPNDYAIEYYKTSYAYPHYLIDWKGNVYNYCAELKFAAHAKWTSEEKKLYNTADWLRYCEKDGKLQEVNPKIYQSWIDRWGMKRGLEFTSPKDILKLIGGKSPNSSFIGIELLDSKPFTNEQHVALANLIKEIFARHEFLDVKDILPNTLPQAWLCGHEDVSPIRRFSVLKNGRGFGWDPGKALDYRLLEKLFAK